MADERTMKKREKLILLSKELGLPQSAMIREAVDQFIESKLIEKRKNTNALQAASDFSASGFWADRKDLPDFDKLRTEFDR